MSFSRHALIYGPMSSSGSKQVPPLVGLHSVSSVQ
jgi:hypothetical protein